MALILILTGRDLKSQEPVELNTRYLTRTVRAPYPTYILSKIVSAIGRDQRIDKILWTALIQILGSQFGFYFWGLILGSGLS